MVQYSNVFQTCLMTPIIGVLTENIDLGALHSDRSFREDWLSSLFQVSDVKSCFLNMTDPCTLLAISSLYHQGEERFLFNYVLWHESISTNFCVSIFLFKLFFMVRKIQPQLQ